MLLMYNSSVHVEGTNYTLEYAITKNEEEGEYGINGRLYEKDHLLTSEEVSGITTEWERVERFLHILMKNEVFPVHLRDVMEDLLILEFEESNRN